ncbi:MAG: dynamin family protein [Marinosulfonomonas sp.]|nr:dynamin family protein [Marinosulfonomonas sp.]
MTVNTDASSPFAVGARLKAECDNILTLSEHLRLAAGDDDYDQLLDPVESLLNGAMASISFIGQVKAGKTSLVNALVGKPGFLPSDVNPWTAVVTRLFFGKPGGPHQGAQFAFFDDQQWDKFATRGGRLAELAAEIPESEGKLADVHAEIERMRERAKKQLGNKFQALLGKTHRFDNATTDVLARYICAGDDPDELVKQHVHGRYADITRDASVFFEKEKFAFPTVLVDTPGLNDPLLIREEITIQSLEHSQVFVLVLSAHQAFSKADLYLLRILNALRLDRLIVFVNRVDELTNPETDVPAIREHIQNFLAKENPGTDIPVIFGSAACANNAITGETAVDLKRIESVQAISKGATPPKSSTKFDDPQQQSAWLASGLPMLEQTLSEMIFQGPGKAWTTSARISLDNAAKVISGDIDATLSELKTLHKLLTDKTPLPDSDNGKPAFDIGKYKAESKQLFGVIEQTLDKDLNTALKRIQKGLQEITDDFVEGHDKEFSAYLARAQENPKHVPWSCDTSPLRSTLNHYLRKEFPKIQTKALNNIEKGVGVISQAMVGAGMLAVQGLQMDTARLADQSANTSALSRIVAIDMNSSWWKGWISKFMKAATVRSQMAKMIKAQFLPLQNELLDSMRDQLTASANEAVTSYRDILDNLAAIRAKKAGQADLTSIKSIEDRIAELDKRATVCKKVSTVIHQTLAA